MVSSLKSPPGGHSAGWPPQMFFGFWQWSCFRKSKNVGTSKFWDGGSILKLTIRFRLKMSGLWDVPDLTELAAIWADLMQLILPLKTQPQLFRQLEFRLIVALISRHQHLSLKLSSATRSKMLEISWSASRSKGFFVHSGDPTKTLWHIINSWPCVFDLSISISQGPFVSCGMCGTIFLLGTDWAQVMFARLLLLLVLPTDARRSLAEV